MPTLYVGIDVSKDKFDACVKDEFCNIIMPAKEYEQNKDGINRFVEDLKDLPYKSKTMFLIGLESTGVYHRNLMNNLLERGYYVREFNPIELKGLRKSRIRPTKTDKIDSEILSDAIKLYSITNTTKYLQDKDYIKMKEFGLIYHRITQEIATIKSRMRRNLTQICPGYDKNFSDIMCKSSQEILKKSMKISDPLNITTEEIRTILKKNYTSANYMEDKVVKIKKSLDDSICPDYLIEPLISDVKLLLEHYNILIKQRKKVIKRISRLMKDLNPISLTIPGLGDITGCMILGCIGNINRFNDSNALTAYAGLDPRVYQSGKSGYKTGHISKRGNKYLRRYLDNATIVAIRHNPVIRDTYQRFRHKGKAHKTAMIACSRKLLSIVYSVEKNQKKFYIPKYLQNRQTL